MRQSFLFTNTRKEAPSDEIAKNAQLLIRAGFIHKEMAGVYSFLPLGLRVLNKIISVIREEMNAIGGQELLLTTLQDPRVWEKTGRWDSEDVEIWFKTKIKTGGDAGLSFTHEEPITNIVKEHVRSYKDLPFSAYQFQTKFRNETRAKSGILRGREFLMKDLYSFCRDEAEHNLFYERAKSAYKKIFDRVGIGARTYVTFASGGSFSKYSHEFQTETGAGEDLIHLCQKCGIAVNEEIIKEQSACPSCNSNELVKKKTVEVGNIFTLGTRFSEALGLSFIDEKGERKSVFMGSYGIGPSRLMGTLVELFSDEKGIIWPLEVAPFRVHLVSILGTDGKRIAEESDRLYSELIKKGAQVLYDDRDARAGEKFADADLIGIPTRVVVSEKTLASDKFEVKDRASGEIQMSSGDEVIKKFSQ